ncbi:MAG TPA: pitrilysin family protein, partial [Methylomirabilota bacterium]|nr:pitrilysin family protein [Methylomirabilota bacterium]
MRQHTSTLKPRLLVKQQRRIRLPERRHDIAPDMYQVTRLQNGVTVASAAMPHMASVSLGIWVAVGGRYEPAQLSGASHFIEHLLFKGTKRRSAKQISQDVEGVGGYLNAFTCEENTCFFAKAPHQQFAEVLDVLMDMFLNSVFDSGEIDKERSVIKEELAMYLDQPAHHVHELLNELLWPNQPLGRSLTGTEQTLDEMKRPELTNFFKQNYVADGVLITAAGRVEHSELLNAVDKYARRIQRGIRPRCLPAFNQQQSPNVHLLSKQTEQTQIALGYRTCSRHAPERHAVRMLNTLLGENMSSRLFQVVREDHGLAYSITSSVNFHDDVGSLSIGAGIETARTQEALSLITRETRWFQDKLASRKEISRARDYLIGQLE